MPLSNKALIAHVEERLLALANADKAVEMAAYMKTDMPFYGVQKPDRIPILRELKANFKPATQEEYTGAIKALWKRKHREEKYIAINYAALFPQFMTPSAVPLCEQIIREGQWWDFVDSITIDTIATVLRKYPTETRPLIDAFSEDDDFWIRRAALLAQLNHKKETSHKHLFTYIEKMSAEKEFFIRKAIGWALREYSKSEPERVLKYLQKNKDKLSPLSIREGRKHLVKTGRMKDL
ncbi:MAG: DNA alkylation repair protein [Cyanobacteria bacterium REEB67]|nr:DNA alkylation repair protein [Cyanobacteria bacterium REEB67]